MAFFFSLSKKDEFSFFAGSLEHFYRQLFLERHMLCRVENTVKNIAFLKIFFNFFYQISHYQFVTKRPIIFFNIIM